MCAQMLDNKKKTANTLIKRNKRNKKILQANSLKRDA